MGNLQLEKTFQLDVVPRSWRRERVREILADYLKQYPSARASDLIAHIEKQHGLKVSESTISCARQDLGLAPDCQQARAARARGKKDTISK